MRRSDYRAVKDAHPAAEDAERLCESLDKRQK